LPTSADENHLAERRYVTVVVRLVLDQHGRLIHGEFIDVASVIGVRFSGWRGLIRAVRSWLAQQPSAPEEPHHEQ
jgi:hypothetical protein